MLHVRPIALTIVLTACGAETQPSPEPATLPPEPMIVEPVEPVEPEPTACESARDSDVLCVSFGSRSAERLFMWSLEAGRPCPMEDRFGFDFTLDGSIALVGDRAYACVGPLGLLELSVVSGSLRFGGARCAGVTNAGDELLLRSSAGELIQYEDYDAISAARGHSIGMLRMRHFAVAGDRLFATDGSDDTIHIFSYPALEPMGVVDLGLLGGIAGLAALPSEQLVVVPDDGAPMIVDASGEIGRTLSGGSGMYGVACGVTPTFDD